MFNPRDVDAINQIYLSKEPVEDKLIWIGTIDGNLSMKEAYKIEMASHNNQLHNANVY